MSGKTITIEINEECKIENLMSKIEDKEGVPSCLQRLSFSGKYLDMKKELKEYKILSESTINLSVSVNGAGIKGLTQVIEDNASSSIKEVKIKDLFGRKIAIDASMALYGFLIAIRPDSFFNLTNQSGEATSHLQGMFYRTLKLLGNGIKPVYVFDGKPPTLKSGELAKRSKKKKEAQTGKQKLKNSRNNNIML